LLESLNMWSKKEAPGILYQWMPGAFV
jgi:hypothetical protein